MKTFAEMVAALEADAGAWVEEDDDEGEDLEDSKRREEDRAQTLAHREALVTLLKTMGEHLQGLRADMAQIAVRQDKAAEEFEGLRKAVLDQPMSKDTL